MTWTSRAETNPQQTWNTIFKKGLRWWWFNTAELSLSGQSSKGHGGSEKQRPAKGRDGAPAPPASPKPLAVLFPSPGYRLQPRGPLADDKGSLSLLPGLASPQHGHCEPLPHSPGPSPGRSVTCTPACTSISISLHPPEAT